ncbi:MAG: hypothetical protein K1X28_04635 [Parachlamydiales bacterium]|nr:hypothetical protein [Parachlamydiales bacterium]
MAQLARRIEIDPECRAHLIPELVDGIFKLHEKIDPDQFPYRFFAYHLRIAGLEMQKAEGDQIPILAKKVQRAVENLKLVHQPPNKQIRFENQVNTDPALKEAFDEKSAEKIRSRALELEHIEKEQLQQLYLWAVENWDVPVLDRILRKWTISDQNMDALVAKALQIDRFATIADAIVLLHLPNLADDLIDRVIDWFDETSGEIYTEIAGVIADIEAALEEAAGKAKQEFFVVSADVSKDQVNQMLDKTTSLFPVPKKEDEDTALGVAYCLWNEIVDAWKKGEFTPSKLRDDLQHVLEILDKPMQPRSGRDSSSRGPSKGYGTFVEMGDLPFAMAGIPETDQKADGLPETDEKYDPHEFFAEIHDGIEKNQTDAVRRMILSRKGKQLSVDELRDLLNHAMQNHYDCLEAVLESPKISKDVFMEYFLTALYQDNWEKLILYFLAVDIFKTLTFEELLPFTEKFATAKGQAIQQLWQDILIRAQEL